MEDRRQPTLFGRTAATAVANVIGHGAEVLSVAEHERRQRGPTRGERKLLTRKAADELRAAGESTLVLAHLHPRWLRELVDAALGQGMAVTEADIALWRSEGPRR